VSRRYTDNATSYLDIWAKDGSPIKSPQTFLDRLLGYLSFDPEEFSRMDEKTQRATLLKLVKLDINLDEVTAKRDALFKERTDVNRELNRQQGALAKMPAPRPGLPERETSAAELIAAIQAAQEQRQANATERQRLETLRTEATTAKATIKTTDDKIADLEAQLAALREQRKGQVKQYDDLVARGVALKTTLVSLVDPDVAPLQEQLSSLETVNAAIRDADRYRSQAAEVEASTAKSASLTAALATLEDTKTRALQQATFPIQRLGFSDEGVTFNGLPFQQASAAEKIRVSLAIGMSLNPKIRIIRITNGSLLDNQSLAIVKDMARASGYQIFIETVGDDRPGIIIEDGTVKGAPLPTPRPARRKGSKALQAGPKPLPTPAATPAPAGVPTPAPAAPRSGLAAVFPPLPLTGAAAPKPAAPARPVIPLRKAVLKKQSPPTT
jgi:predicted  nucleic acid-binding Zn-ribbon protein